MARLRPDTELALLHGSIHSLSDARALLLGIAFYFLYGYRKSHVGRGLNEVHELDADSPPGAVPPMPGAPVKGQD